MSAGMEETVTRLVIMAAGAGCIASVAVPVLLQLFAGRPNSLVNQLREDDLVCLMESAWAAGTAGFSFWSTRTCVRWFRERRDRLSSASTVLTACCSFVAVALLGFFVERRFDETLQSSSLPTLGIAGLGALALVAWQRPFRSRRQTRS